MITTTRWGYGPAYPIQEQPSRQYDYKYGRDLSAFYIQTDLNIGNYVTLYPGARYESYDIDYEAYYINRYGPEPYAFRSTKLNVDSIEAQTGKVSTGYKGDRDN